MQTRTLQESTQINVLVIIFSIHSQFRQALNKLEGTNALAYFALPTIIEIVEAAINLDLFQFFKK